MIRNMSFIAMAMGAAFSASANSQPLPPEVANSLPEGAYVPDFSYAGYGFGIEPIPTEVGKIVRVTKFGAKPNDEIDDTTAIQRALDAARKLDGPVSLRFPAGKFIITDIISIDRSDFRFSGAGNGRHGTTLYFPRPLQMIDDKGKFDELREYLLRYNKRQRNPEQNLDVLFSEYSWTGGFIWVGRDGSRPAPYLEENDGVIPSIGRSTSGTRGSRTLTFEDADGSVKVGDRIQLLWYNRDGENGLLLKEIYGDTDEKIGSHHWTFPNRPLVRQRTRVEAIDGAAVTIADPLLHNISPEIPVEIATWAPIERVGIEGFRFEFPDTPYFGHHVERGYSGIYLSGLADGWVRNVSFTNADSGILTYDSANLTISNIQSLGDRPAHYAVHMGNVHNVLAERIQVFNPVLHSLTFNTQSTKSVYKDSEVFASSTLDQHAGANHQNLFDNITLHISAKKEGSRYTYPVFDGSGAGYWQPGHGQFNTTWNLNIQVNSGAYANDRVLLQGLAEGPNGRIIGVSGNREFDMDYRPTPIISHMNKRLTTTPSLYDFQRQLRLDELDGTAGD